jgi:raffinose/stachyose/melibiose transport system substrate-binding protein
MKGIKKRVLSTLLCTVMGAGLMAGCGNAASNSNTTSGESAATSSSAEAASNSSQDDQKLVIMHMFTDELVEQNNAEAIVFQDAIKRFKESHPDVEVEEEQISQNAGYESKIKTLAAANELPDVFEALPSMMSTFYDNGQVMDLAPVLEEDAEWKDTFTNGAFGDFTFGDKVLGAPRCAIVNHVLYWNKDIFNKCGLTEFPKDSDEFLEDVKILKENGYIPLASGNKGKYMIASQVMPGILFKFVSNDWYESLKNYEGASFEDEDALAAISYMDELMKAGMFNDDVNSIDEFQARQLYYSGKAAMYVEGSWSVSSFITDCDAAVKDNTEMTVFPPVKGKEDLANQMVSGQGWGMALNSNLSDTKKQLAIDFLKELTSPEIQGEGVEKGLLSVIKDTPYDESKIDPFYQKFLDLYNSMDTKVGCPEVQLSTAYMDASYNGYQEMSVGSITPEELAKELQQAHESAKK